MSSAITVSASDFKARCLDLLDRVTDRSLTGITITKRGRAAGILIPPETEADAVAGLHGFMRGSVAIAPDIDLTEPVLDEPLAAEDGTLHA